MAEHKWTKKRMQRALTRGSYAKTPNRILMTKLCENTQQNIDYVKAKKQTKNAIMREKCAYKRENKQKKEIQPCGGNMFYLNVFYLPVLKQVVGQHVE